MNTWYLKNLGDGILAAVPLSEIAALFQVEYAKAGSPQEMAIFTRQESEGHLHCEVTVYFSPAAAVIAHAVDAHRCERPLPDNLSLLAGVEAAWLVLFRTSLT